MSVVDDILQRRPNVRREAQQLCDCASDNAVLFSIWVDQDAARYVYVNPQPGHHFETGEKLKSPPMAILLDGEPEFTVVACPRCRAGWALQTTADKRIELMRLGGAIRGVIAE